MSEQEFTPQQSVVLVNSMINQVKHRFSGNSVMYQLWGRVVFICSATQFILIRFTQLKFHYAVCCLTWIAMAFRAFYFNCRQKQQQLKTCIRHIMAYVWLSVVGLVLLVCFLMGIISWFKSLLLGGVSCWILTIIAPFIYGHYRLLLIPAARVVAWITPGYLLRHQYKKATHHV